MNRFLEKAFPPDLVLSLGPISDRLMAPSNLDPSDVFAVIVASGPIEIPYRIYVEPLTPQEIDHLPEKIRGAVACWFSRHHNGRIREDFLRSITAYDSDWIIGYVLPLSGEYVLPILELIWDRRDRFDISVLRSWLKNNDSFYHTVRRRVVSYWNCYHRPGNPDFRKYVGGRLIDFFDGYRKPACNAISA